MPFTQLLGYSNLIIKREEEKEYLQSAYWLLFSTEVTMYTPSIFLQIINAALALASRPKSQVVKNTMEMYKRTWEHYIHVLTEAVDDITSIDDFLAVSGNAFVCPQYSLCCQCSCHNYLYLHVYSCVPAHAMVHMQKITSLTFLYHMSSENLT